MAREILFKAKRIDNGEWVEGHYAVAIDKRGLKQHNILVADHNLGYFNWFVIDEKTLCQFTGLLDHYGNKIFENDVVFAGDNIVVTWNEYYASWSLTKKGWMYSHFFGESVEPQDCNVIGNIFDNPELLGGADNG